jgi:DNA polymerase-3 subunit beta
MVLTIDLSILKAVVGGAAKAAARRADNPMHGAVLITVGPDGLRAVGGDGIIRVESPAVPCDGDLPDGVCLDAARLVAVLGGLDGDSVRLTADKKRQRVILRCGKSEYSLSALDPADYPPAPETGAGSSAVLCSGQTLAEALAEVAPAVSSDPNRYGLNGVKVEAIESSTAGAPDALRFVATDGLRLTWQGVPLYNGTLPKLPKTELLSTPWCALVRERAAGVAAPVTLTWMARAVAAEVAGWTIYGRTVDGEFPDYRLVLPPKHTREVTVSAPAWAAALKRAQIMASDRNNSVKCAFEEGRILMRAQDLKAGEVTEEVQADMDGAPLQTGFNAGYVLDLLRAAGSAEVTLRMGEALDPVVITVDGRADFCGVVMPMRLD